MKGSILVSLPKSGKIRLEMYEASTKLFDTGDIFDNGLAGGRVGVFTFSQERAIWSQLKYICKEEWTMFKVLMNYVNCYCV